MYARIVHYKSKTTCKTTFPWPIGTCPTVLLCVFGSTRFLKIHLRIYWICKCAKGHSECGVCAGYDNLFPCCLSPTVVILFFSLHRWSYRHLSGEICLHPIFGLWFMVQNCGLKIPNQCSLSDPYTQNTCLGSLFSSSDIFIATGSYFQLRYLHVISQLSTLRWDIAYYSLSTLKWLGIDDTEALPCLHRREVFQTSSMVGLRVDGTSVNLELSYNHH